jgi:uncharacterized membrane protein YhhN
MVHASTWLSILFLHSFSIGLKVEWHRSVSGSLWDNFTEAAAQQSNFDLFVGHAIFLSIDDDALHLVTPRSHFCKGRQLFLVAHAAPSLLQSPTVQVKPVLSPT